MALISGCDRYHKHLNTTDASQKKQAEDGRIDKSRNTRTGLKGGTFLHLAVLLLLLLTVEKYYLVEKFTQYELEISL